MTSVLDDVLGHTCFVAGAGPWVGNTALMRRRARHLPATMPQ
jgi:hypothetical protein